MIHHSFERFDDLVSIDAIEAMLELAPRRPTFRMVRDGSALPVGSYTKTVRLGGTWTGEVADLDAIAQHFGTGATLILQSLDRTHPPLRTFAHELQSEISHPVQANAYLSPANSAGLAPHSDTHDVLVLQVEGEKRWDIADLGCVHVHPGDVVYIPRGHRHAATTIDRHSLHITIGITAVTYEDVARRALGVAPGMDAALGLGFARAPSDEQVSAMAGALADAIDALAAADPSQVAVAERRRVERVGAERRSLRTQLATGSVSDDTTIARRAGSTWRVVDGRVVIELRDRQVRMPMRARPAVESIFSRPELPVADLAGLDAPSRLVLARRLIRDGLLDIRRP